MPDGLTVQPKPQEWTFILPFGYQEVETIECDSPRR
jgi:hypothetical protein